MGEKPHAVLIVFSENQSDQNGKFNDILFVRQKDPYYEMWEGKRLGIQGAKAMGFNRVIAKEKFINHDIEFEAFDQVLFFDFQNDIINTSDSSDLFDLLQSFKTKINYSEKSTEIK